MNIQTVMTGIFLATGLVLGLGAGQTALAASIKVKGFATYDASIRQNKPDLVQELIADGTVFHWDFTLNIDTDVGYRQDGTTLNTPVRDLFSLSDPDAPAGTLTLTPPTEGTEAQTFNLGVGASAIGGSVNLNNVNNSIDLRLNIEDNRSPSRLTDLTVRIYLSGEKYDFLENPPIAGFFKAEDTTTSAFFYGTKDSNDPNRPTAFSSFIKPGQDSIAETTGLNDTAVVPLPASFGLLASVLGGLGLMARRRRIAAMQA